MFCFSCSSHSSPFLRKTMASCIMSGDSEQFGAGSYEEPVALIWRNRDSGTQRWYVHMREMRSFPRRLRILNPKKELTCCPNLTGGRSLMCQSSREGIFSSRSKPQGPSFLRALCCCCSQCSEHLTFSSMFSSTKIMFLSLRVHIACEFPVGKEMLCSALCT